MFQALFVLVLLVRAMQTTHGSSFYQIYRIRKGDLYDYDARRSSSLWKASGIIS